MYCPYSNVLNGALFSLMFYSSHLLAIAFVAYNLWSACIPQVFAPLEYSDISFWCFGRSLMANNSFHEFGITQSKDSLDIDDC